MELPKSVRVNLSLPPEIDVVVSRAAEVTGRSKAAIVMEALGWYLPKLRRNLETVRSSFGMEYRNPADRGESLQADDDQPAPQLSRQQRRALKREADKFRP